MEALPGYLQQSKYDTQMITDGRLAVFVAHSHRQIRMGFGVSLGGAGVDEVPGRRVGVSPLVTSSSGDYTATLPRKRMGSAVLFRDHSGRVLLVEPTYKDYWELPGGTVDADESLYDAAVRELKEELGLAVAPGRLLVVDWVPPREGRTEGVMFVYDGGILDATQTAEISVPPEELRGWAWSTLPQAQQRLSPLLARRAAAALEAVADGVTRYLEDGKRIA
ncbi:NUDIX domain-containing protein [Micromonospora sp. CA-263727]|uniref:NUDIX domain-containing protein n=1 Tax=Micromonospora sp. CA-263727 TaxID=3239967 RepID=UPI003D8D10A3